MPGSEPRPLAQATTARRLPRASEPSLEPPRLVVTWSPDRNRQGLSLPLDGRAFELGRESELSFEDARMSRRHARIRQEQGHYVVEDLGSTNGCFVNGRRVEGTATLGAGVLVLGDTALVVDPPASLDDLPRRESHAEVETLGPTMVGDSQVTAALRASIRTVGRTAGAVFLRGETGVGKDVTARAIHAHSRRKGPFLALNCAAIPASLAESELFGHVSGAFSGADGDRLGAFREADGGTLFLDEVADLSKEVQAKLLRVLEDGWVRPLGGGRPVKVDVRVLAATCLDIEELGFRADLYARLSDWVLRIPSLLERRADILPLWAHFLRAADRAPEGTTPETVEALLLHEWPMNVRELQRLVGRVASLTGPEDPIDLHLLPASMREAVDAGARRSPRSEPAAVPTPETLVEALREAMGNVKLAAESRGWHRTQMYRWLRKYGIDPATFRAP